MHLLSMLENCYICKHVPGCTLNQWRIQGAYPAMAPPSVLAIDFGTLLAKENNDCKGANLSKRSKNGNHEENFV